MQGDIIAFLVLQVDFDCTTAGTAAGTAADTAAGHPRLSMWTHSAQELTRQTLDAPAPASDWERWCRGTQGLLQGKHAVWAQTRIKLQTPAHQLQ